MKWKSLYITDTKQLKLELKENRIIIKDIEKGDFFKIFLQDVDLILIDSYKFTISASLLSELAKNHISLIITSPTNHQPNCFLVNPFSNHYKRGKIIENQFLTLKNENKKFEMAKRIIYAKIVNSSIMTDNKFKKIAMKNITNIDSLLAFEGSFAKEYWKNLKIKRVYKKIIDIDIKNSFLNYGYAILRARISSAITQFGMIPSLSIFHSNSVNPFALADDLIEPFSLLLTIF